MGKWTKLRGKLEVFQNEPEWQQKVDAFKLQFLGTDNTRDASPAMLGKEYALRKRKKDELEDKIKALNVELEGLSQIIVEVLEDEEIQKIELASGQTIGISDEPYPWVADRQKFFAFIKRTGQASLLTVHFQTMKALVKGYLEQGKPAPPGIKVYLKTSATLRNARNGDGE